MKNTIPYCPRPRSTWQRGQADKFQRSWVIPWRQSHCLNSLVHGAHIAEVPLGDPSVEIYVTRT